MTLADALNLLHSWSNVTLIPIYGILWKIHGRLSKLEGRLKIN